VREADRQCSQTGKQFTAVAAAAAADNDGITAG